MLINLYRRDDIALQTLNQNSKLTNHLMLFSTCQHHYFTMLTWKEINVLPYEINHPPQAFLYQKEDKAALWCLAGAIE
jgi:hypothetical protein